MGVGQAVKRAQGHAEAAKQQGSWGGAQAGDKVGADGWLREASVIQKSWEDMTGFIMQSGCRKTKWYG